MEEKRTYDPENSKLPSLVVVDLGNGFLAEVRIKVIMDESIAQKLLFSSADIIKEALKDRASQLIESQKEDKSND